MLFVLVNARDFVSQLFAALLFVGLMAGCASKGDKVEYDDYRASTAGERLEIPPNLAQIDAQGAYSLPKDAPRGPVSASGLKQQALKKPARVLLQPGNVIMRREYGERWLEVKASPDELWPQIREFWQDNGLIIKLENTKTGIMETDWAEKRPRIKQGVIRDALTRALGTLYTSGTRDKYRTRIEPSETPGATDIFISHRGMEEVYITEGRDDTRWQQRPANTGFESEMLRRLMVYLGESEETAKEAIAAQPGDIPTRATLNETNQSLSLPERFDRAWRRTGLALDRGGFTVEDRNRSKGIYYVRYIDPDAKEDSEGFFSSLAFWRDKPKKSATIERPQRLIEVKALGTRSQVRVMLTEQKQDRSEVGNNILQLLYKQLK